MDQKWQESINQLNDRREAVAKAGGEERVAKQHASGKLTARERMEALFDDSTFSEINDMIMSRCSDFGMDKIYPRQIGVRVFAGFHDRRRLAGRGSRHEDLPCDGQGDGDEGAVHFDQ